MSDYLNDNQKEVILAKYLEACNNELEKIKNKSSINSDSNIWKSINETEMLVIPQLSKSLQRKCNYKIAAIYLKYYKNTSTGFLCYEEAGKRLQWIENINGFKAVLN